MEPGEAASLAQFDIIELTRPALSLKIFHGSKSTIKIHLGHSCKIGNMRPAGTLENQNP